MNEIDSILHGAVERGVVPGVVAMATDGTRTLYEGAFGSRKLGGDAAMTGDSLFWIASLTKAVTATAAMQMVEQGRVGLHQPLGAVVPKLANPQVLEGFGSDGQPILRAARREVTLHDLLTHTSGYVYETWNPALKRYVEVTGKPGIASGLTAGLEMPLAFEPGTRWEYGIGIDWAGKMVEALTGQGLGSYLAEHIFAPLGMADTQFGRPDSDRMVTMHVRLPDGGLQVSSTSRPARPETVAMMGQNQIGTLDVGMLATALPLLSNDAEFFPGMPKGWGYSFIINSQAGHAGRAANSLAWAGLANCYYWIDPASQLAGLIMTQIMPFADAAVLALLDAFEAALYRSLAAAE